MQERAHSIYSIQYTPRVQERRAELRERLRLLHVEPLAHDPAPNAHPAGPQRSRPGTVGGGTSESDDPEPAQARARARARPGVRRGGQGEAGAKGRAEREEQKLREVERALAAPGLVPHDTKRHVTPKDT